MKLACSESNDKNLPIVPVSIKVTNELRTKNCNKGAPLWCRKSTSILLIKRALLLMYSSAFLLKISIVSVHYGKTVIYTNTDAYSVQMLLVGTDSFIHVKHTIRQLTTPLWCRMYLLPPL